MFIILEGIDKTGKTSLANHLSKKFDLPIIKFSKPKGDPYEEYLNFLLTHKKPAILDRFYLGEEVYGPVKRGKSGLKPWQLRTLENLVMMRNSFNIYSYTNFAEIKENFVKEKEEYATIDDIMKLHQQYYQVIEKSNVGWYNFNYLEDGNYEKIDKLIRDWQTEYKINEHALKAQIDARTIGNFYADTLILGEVCNMNKLKDGDEKTMVPFNYGHSAEFVFKALQNIPTNRYAISNVMKVHNGGKVNIKAELELPNLKTIICLGNTCAKAIKDLKLDEIYQVVTIPHPSYFARFQQYDYNKYGNMIYKIINSPKEEL